MNRQELMIPPTLIPVLQTAITSKTAAQFAQYAPIIIAQMKDQKPAELSDSEKELMESFFQKFQTLIASSGQATAQYAKGFQELSHKQKLELMEKLDTSKLDSEGTTKILEIEIREGHKSSRWNTLITGGAVVIGLLAMFNKADKAGQRSYHLKRPRSLSEKMFGDKK